MKSRVFGLIFVVSVAIAGICRAYPEPAIVQGSGDWTLEVVFDQPGQINVQIPGEMGQNRFWYIIVTLKNSSGKDAPFYPKCDLMTDTFQIVEAGRRTRQVVFDQIKLKHQGSYPFLEPLDFVENKVLQGADNAKDIALIWSDFDAKAKNVTFFIAGLSNETVEIDHPTAVDANGNPKKVYLRKTLALDYSIGGDETLRAGAQLVYKGKRWVMR